MPDRWLLKDESTDGRQDDVLLHCLEVTRRLVRALHRKHLGPKDKHAESMSSGQIAKVFTTGQTFFFPEPKLGPVPRSLQRRRTKL